MNYKLLFFIMAGAILTYSGYLVYCKYKSQKEKKAINTVLPEKLPG